MVAQRALVPLDQVRFLAELFFATYQTRSPDMDEDTFQAPQQPPTDVIYEDRTYSDEYDRSIVVKTPMKGNLPDLAKMASYVTRIALAMETPMGPQQIPLKVSIKAANLEEAFQKHDEACEEEARRFVKQMRDHQRAAQTGLALPPGMQGRFHQG